MKRFLLGLMLMLSLSVMPVMAQEDGDRTWIESLPPNQDSIETPWFIRDTTGSTLAERLKDDEKKEPMLVLLVIPCLAAGSVTGYYFLRKNNRGQNEKP